MILEIQHLLPPVIGGVIGWSTNKLAIWMLFNPKKEKRILGLRIPFTPGLMPRDQILIAKSLGTLVDERLIDPKEIDNRITKEKLDIKVAELFDKVIEKNMGKLAFFIPDMAVQQGKKLLVPKISALVKEESSGFISMIDFRELVEAKVSSFPLEELEQAIKSVTKKHLAHITLLGGVLGFIIGLVQIVVNEYLL